MADLADVEEALLAIITATIYPNGVGAGPIASVGDTLVDIRRGWPLPAMLDLALASGRDVLVRIYPEVGMTRNTSRFTLQWRDFDQIIPTLTVSVTGSVVTFAGTGDENHAAGIMVGAVPHGTPYAYRLLPGDGPDDVASALATMIGGGTSAVGPVVTVSTNSPIIARVGVDQRSFLETRRQDQGFRVSIWSSNNVARDAVAAAIDNALAYLTDANGNPTMNLILADGSAGWLRYRNTHDMDNAEKAGLYRRDLCYFVEYPTSLVQLFPEVLFPIAAVAIAEQPVVNLTY